MLIVFQLALLWDISVSPCSMNLLPCACTAALVLVMVIAKLYSSTSTEIHQRCSQPLKHDQIKWSSRSVCGKEARRGFLPPSSTARLDKDVIHTLLTIGVQRHGNYQLKCECG